MCFSAKGAILDSGVNEGLSKKGFLAVRVTVLTEATGAGNTAQKWGERGVNRSERLRHYWGADCSYCVTVGELFNFSGPQFLIYKSNGEPKLYICGNQIRTLYKLMDFWQHKTLDVQN